ncbi:MAG TPA: twin-arginine translocation signal domain-containing protein, partial [Opitutus sp.]|nr:twin-arginine translocation signal domain-containing protein [Opitutus sp.]
MTSYPLNRREFLRNASVAAAGFALAASGPRLFGQARGANDRIRVGVVGFSDRFRDALLPALKSAMKDINLEIVGVSDLWGRRREEAVAFFAKELGVQVPTYRNNEELYEKAKPDGW